MEYFTLIAAAINSIGVLAAVQLIKTYAPRLREKASWVIPILAGAIGPAVAVGQNALGAWLGIAIDLSPLVGVFTGATAVAVNQVYKQAVK